MIGLGVSLELEHHHTKIKDAQGDKWPTDQKDSVIVHEVLL